MQKIINLINLDKSDIKYVLTTFPDGEPHIKLDEINRKEDYQVICRITNPNELFILMQVADILDRQDVVWNLYITYLMSQRMDRVINFNEAFSLKVISNILENFKCNQIEIFELHSDRIHTLFKDMSRIWNDPKFGEFNYLFENATTCYPDHGAYERYSHRDEESTIILNKKRDLEHGGKIISIEIESVPDITPTRIVVSDDLCDAGGTFIGAAKILREKYPNVQLDIFVRHMVNPIGIKNLSENYDNVYFTNSYRDWDNLPANCHLIEII